MPATSFCVRLRNQQKREHKADYRSFVSSSKSGLHAFGTFRENRDRQYDKRVSFTSDQNQQGDQRDRSATNQKRNLHTADTRSYTVQRGSFKSSTSLHLDLATHISLLRQQAQRRRRCEIKAMLVVGARPQFIKSAPVVKEILSKHKRIDLCIIHTGQHYEQQMSEVFFHELKLPAPSANLQAGSDISQTTVYMNRL